MKDIAEKDLIYKINDIILKRYIFKAKNLEINISASPKINIFKIFLKYKYMIKQS